MLCQHLISGNSPQPTIAAFTRHRGKTQATLATSPSSAARLRPTASAHPLQPAATLTHPEWILSESDASPAPPTDTWHRWVSSIAMSWCCPILFTTNLKLWASPHWLFVICSRLFFYKEQVVKKWLLGFWVEWLRRPVFLKNTGRKRWQHALGMNEKETPP